MFTKHGLLAGGLAVLALLLPTVSQAQDSETYRQEKVTGNLVAPARRDFSETLMKQLKLPAGFEVNVFAKDLDNARMMAVAADGTIYLSRQKQNDVMALKDTDNDGRADQVRKVASNLEQVHGVALYQNRLYLAAPTKVWVAEVKADGTLATPKLLIGDLPDGGQHRGRNIAIGPDQKLYVAVGSTCNACDEANKESATVLRFNLDGTNRQTYAKGLRHTIGFGWHPVTGDLWGMDMGTDWRGDDIPPEELNRITEGSNYGWPYCFANRQIDPYVPGGPEGIPVEQYCAATVPPVLTYQAHNAPIGKVFYNAAQFPAEYRGDAFVALRGSWNRSPASGYKVVRVRFEKGQPVGFEDFLSGFLLEDGKAHFGRLAGVAVAGDGALLVSDDSNGVIYRVSYKVPAKAASKNVGAVLR